MKFLVIALLCAQNLQVFAAGKKNKGIRNPSSETCLISVKNSALDSEAKAVGLDKKDIQIVAEPRIVGNGNVLFIASTFVSSSKTADNTHWEVAGETNFTDGSCKIVYSKRVEAP